jgi:hypothetical protein
MKSEKLQELEANTPQDPNTIYGFFGEYRFLSNFHPCEITDDYELIYPSTENAYQAAKHNAVDVRKLFVNISPGGAKKLSKKIKPVENWDNIKLMVMKKLNKQKFTKHEELKNKLLATGDKILVEGNWWNDIFYGVCNGVGENNLGKILMEIRNEVKVS